MRRMIHHNTRMLSLPVTTQEGSFESPSTFWPPMLFAGPGSIQSGLHAHLDSLSSTASLLRLLRLRFMRLLLLLRPLLLLGLALLPRLLPPTSLPLLLCLLLLPHCLGASIPLLLLLLVMAAACSCCC